MSFLSSWLPFGHVRASASARRAAMETARIDLVLEKDKAATLIAGGAQVEGALPVRAERFDGAVYSSRGRGYARYNEDAAGLFTDARGWVYGIVCDQAGGLGGTIRGQASALAAHHVFDAFQRLAKLPEPAQHGVVVAELRAAYDRAHHALVARNDGEVTTAVSAVLKPGEAVVLNTGDSAAMLFDKTGALKEESRQQELGPPNEGCLEHSLGLVPEGPNAERYTWPLAAGDALLLMSDGVLDSGLGAEELGKLLAGSKDAEDAVNKLCTTVLRRMGTFRAKPDNLSVALVRAL